LRDARNPIPQAAASRRRERPEGAATIRCRQCSGGVRLIRDFEWSLIKSLRADDSIRVTHGSNLIAEYRDRFHCLNPQRALLSTMVHKCALALLGGVLIFTIAKSTIYAEADRAASVISIQIQGETQVDPATLFGARADVMRLYHDAGVHLSWVTSHPDLVIIICGQRDACDVGGSSSSTLGQAIINKTSRQGRIAYVYHERVTDFAEQAGMESADLLGYVIAHEVAHLLGVSHGSTGLMRAGWDVSELTLASCGLLHFSVPEEEVVRRSAAILAASSSSNSLIER